MHISTQYCPEKETDQRLMISEHSTHSNFPGTKTKNQKFVLLVPWEIEPGCLTNSISCIQKLDHNKNAYNTSGTPSFQASATRKYQNTQLSPSGFLICIIKLQKLHLHQNSQRQYHKQQQKVIHQIAKCTCCLVAPAASTPRPGPGHCNAS